MEEEDDEEADTFEEEGEEKEYDEEAEEYSPEPPSLFKNEEDNKEGEEPLYPGASISVLATCTFLWSLVKTAGWRVEHVEMLLNFLATCVLPRDNLLPRSMYRMERLIKTPNMNACTFRMCRNGCLVWHARDEKDLGIRPSGTSTCDKCGSHLFRKHAGRWVPSSKVYYFGIESMVR